MLKLVEPPQRLPQVRLLVKQPLVRPQPQPLLEGKAPPKAAAAVVLVKPQAKQAELHLELKRAAEEAVAVRGAEEARIAEHEVCIHMLYT